MINVNSIVHEIFLLLSSDSVLVGSNVNITKGEPINTDPHLTPWITIHRGTKLGSIGRIGSNKPWNVAFSVNIYHQEFGEEDANPYDTWQRIEDMEERILNLVSSLGNLSLNTTVDVLDSIETSPIYDENLSQRFLMNIITLNYRARG